MNVNIYITKKNRVYGKKMINFKEENTVYDTKQQTSKKKGGIHSAEDVSSCIYTDTHTDYK